MTERRSRFSAGDPFLDNYQPSELHVAAEFLSTWLPFLSADLCQHCVRKLSNRIRSIDSSSSSSKSGLVEASTSTESVILPLSPDPVKREIEEGRQDDNNRDDARSIGNWKEGDDGVEACRHSIESWKDGGNELSRTPLDALTSRSAKKSPVIQTPAPRLMWADMAQDDELAVEDDEEEEQEVNRHVVHGSSSNRESLARKSQSKPELSREKREYIRFMNVKREKDFICFERIQGKPVNILKGLELHMGIFSAAEQKRIVDYVYELREMGKKGELKERTYTAPQKWMKGKGRETIQFGCCYNYATDRKGNPPGILYNELVDPLPHLFKVIIRRLVTWHVLPPTCVPDSCIVNIYEEGDCIPPHIDNHDFVRPFCTVSFLSECNILFGLNLKIEGPGEFSGSHSIPLPVGSVLVLNGNGADVAKHCVPAVPTKRISITFRRMDESKRPANYKAEADLLDLQPLSFESDKPTTPRPSQSNPQRPIYNRQFVRRESSSSSSSSRDEGRGILGRGDIQSEPRNLNRNRQVYSDRRRIRVVLGS